MDDFDFDLSDLDFDWLDPRALSPFWRWILALIVSLVFALILWAILMPPEKKERICLDRAAKLGVEARYDDPGRCLVKVGEGRWMRINDYEGASVTVEPNAAH